MVKKILDRSAVVYYVVNKYIETITLVTLKKLRIIIFYNYF